MKVLKIDSMRKFFMKKTHTLIWGWNTCSLMGWTVIWKLSDPVSFCAEMFIGKKFDSY
jgi:hypothetical protein